MISEESRQVTYRKRLVYFAVPLRVNSEKLIFKTAARSALSTTTLLTYLHYNRLLHQLALFSYTSIENLHFLIPLWNYKASANSVNKRCLLTDASIAPVRSK